MKSLGFADIKKGWNWVEGLEGKFESEKWNGKFNSSGRKCLWFGLGVDLGFNSKVFEGEKINSGLKNRVDDLWKGEDWNSILVYKYSTGCELKMHIDREIFEDKTIIINFCKSTVGFLYGTQLKCLKDGEIIEINNRIKHGVLKVSSTRYSVSIRKIK